MDPRPQRIVAAAVLGMAMLAAGCRHEPRKSQPALLVQHLGETTITIRYNRPSARGRVLFGGIVPFGAPWDPGADEATTFDTDRAITFGGQALAAGTYSVWAIPGPNTWTIILSRASHVFHIPYPAGKDAMRFTVTPTTGAYEETLAFDFPVAESDHATVALRWGTTVILIPIETRPT